jgi:hypothetical protein
MDKMDAIRNIRNLADRVAIERLLREGGWVHLDDEVEGTELCDIDDIGICRNPSVSPCKECEYYNRPATIRDLIGRK